MFYNSRREGTSRVGTAVKESRVNGTFKAKQSVDGISEVRKQVFQSRTLTRYTKRETEIFIGTQGDINSITGATQGETPYKTQETTFIEVTVLRPNREERQPSSGGGTRRGNESAERGCYQGT
jgi:hypothetical protein